MIFGNETISTYSRSNMSIWITMAFQAGLLNVGGFLASHTFVSHLTGFATLAGIEAEQGHLTRFWSLILAPISFLLGAMVSGILVDLRIKLKKKPNYYLVFGLIFFLSTLVSIAGTNDFFGPFGQTLNSWDGYCLITLLCFICGVQNGAVTLVSRSVIRTTHLTGITTDLGIGLVRTLNRNRLNDQNDENKANVMRASIILFFMLGSIVGVPTFQKFGFLAFLLPSFISGCLFFLMLFFQVIQPLIIKNSTTQKH